MKFTSALASTIACLTVTAMAQGGPISPCTYTATPCTPLHGGDGTQTVTIYEVPFTATAVENYDCQGCTEVTVEPKDCFGPGPVVPPITATTTTLAVETTTTLDVCSPTP